MSNIIYKKICGIYKITSPSERVYIGQSVDIKRRWSKHKIRNCKGQTRLWESFRKYGHDRHIFEIIEECGEECLNHRERHWQDKYDVLSTKGLNCKLTETTDKTGTGRIIQQKSSDGILINEAKRNVYMQEGFQMSQISRCCTGKAKTHKGFTWQYKQIA